MLDYSTDPAGAVLRKIATVYGLPAFVKAAGHRGPELCPDAETPARMFADPVNRRLPCHTKASAWCSLAYFAEAGGGPANVAEKLAEFAVYWDLEDEAARLHHRHQAMAKTAAEERDEDYAFVLTHPDTGHTIRHMPVRDPAGVKEAAAYLRRHADKFSFEQRHLVANRVLDKAASLGADVSEQRDWLEMQAARGVGSPAAIEAMLRDRAALAKQADVKAKITVLADAVRDRPHQILTADGMLGLVKTVEAVDRGIGLTSYSEKIPAAEEVVFSATFSKAAEAMTNVCTSPTGRVYEKAALHGMKLDALRDTLGSDFAAEVRVGINSIDVDKLAEFLPTLPAPDAELFDQVADLCGVRPVATKAASYGVGFAAREWAEFSKAYQAGSAA